MKMSRKFDNVDYLKGKIQDSNDANEVGDLEELQLAFQKGLLQKGVHREYNKIERQVINNVPGLTAKLTEIARSLPLIEVLQFTVDPAPLAPEMAVKIDEMKESPQLDDDFGREIHFYRIAQSAVLEALPKLNHLGIQTVRPTDYFAQMAKSDNHMQKVRQSLTRKHNVMEMKEKAKKLRDLKKFGKKVQNETIFRRQKEKREMLDNIKKFRKGQKQSLDFLDDPFKSVEAEEIPRSKKELRAEMDDIRQKRRHKDKKYGFGGKKRQLKRVTAKDVDDSFNPKERKKNSGQNFARRNMNQRRKKNKNK